MLEGARQGFVGSVTWHQTWQALLAIAALQVVLGSVAVRSMRRYGV